MIELVRSTENLNVDSIAWSQTLELARAYSWKPSFPLSRLIARGLKVGVEIEVSSQDAEALASSLQRALLPQRISHRRMLLWGVIGQHAMDRTDKFDGSEQRAIISFCESGSFRLRRKYG